MILLADWVTEELLSKIQNNSYLSERLLQPKFMEVVAEFQSDPTSASKKYQHNSEIQLFLKEFCVLMGMTFPSFFISFFLLHILLL